MEISSIHKYISLNKLVNGTTEVIFAGQPCLTVAENMFGMSYWKINPVFAKLVYGANIFEDIPFCTEDSDSTEEAIAAGLVKLHELGAFTKEVDFPEDTYAATMVAVSENVKSHVLSVATTLLEAHAKYSIIMKSINNGTFGDRAIDEDRSEYTANLNLSGEKTKKKVHLVNSLGNRISSHDSESDALRSWKNLPDSKGVKIVHEDTDVTDKALNDDIDAKYDKWENDVRNTHPTKKLRFKGRVEKGMHTTSAEEAGHSYGVWDHDKNEGHVFDDEKEEGKEIATAIKKDKIFVTKGDKE